MRISVVNILGAILHFQHWDIFDLIRFKNGKVLTVMVMVSIILYREMINFNIYNEIVDENKLMGIKSAERKELLDIFVHVMIRNRSLC